MGNSPNFDLRELEYQYRRNAAGTNAAKQFSSTPLKFLCTGVNLAVSPDLTPAGKYPILRNVRAYRPGGIMCRPGQILINAIPLDQVLVHSIKRLNDELNGNFTRVIGAGTKLYTGINAFAQRDTGYSGDPLSFVQFRPEQSPEPWVYIADRLKMSKIRRDGTSYAMGIAPPLTAPNAIFAPPAVAIIDAMEASAGWVAGGTAGAITAPNRVNTTIKGILYDVGAAGWVCVEPLAMDGIELSAILNYNLGQPNAETGTVFGVYKAIPSTTIGSITYDAGVVGLCTIQPTALSAPTRKGNPQVRRMMDDFDLLDPYDPVIKRSLSKRNRLLVDRGAIQPPTTWLTALGVVPDALIRLAAGTPNEELVKIISVAVGKDGVASIRVSTTKTHVLLETVDGVRGYRTYLANNHIALEPLTDINLSSTIAAGTGTLTKTTPFNLGVIGARATQDADEIHISVKIDNLLNLIEGRIMFDIDGTTNDFTRNYFFHEFRPNDLIPGIKSSTTMLNARQSALQSRYIDSTQQSLSTRVGAGVRSRKGLDIDDVDLTSRNQRLGGIKQTTTGDSQWFDLHFKISELTRVGEDKSRGLADVAAVRFSIQVKAATVVQLDSLWLGGTYGPDIGELGDPYLWRYRYRSTLTGAKSLASPPMRYGLSAHRQRVQLTPTISPDPQVDRIDWYRFGGLLPEWLYLGSSDEAVAAPYFDEIADEDLVFSDLLEFDNFQPFPTVDTPKQGTCDVSGTAVTRKTGDNFNTAWAPGTVININGINHVVYAQPSTILKLETVENCGTLLNVKWFVNEPVLLGQPFPVIFGPFNGFVMGVGDKYRPGTLAFCKGNDADSAPETFYLEVTDPSDPLMNGGIHDGRAIVASTKRFFAIYPAFSDASVFTVLELPVGGGLFSRWGFAIGPEVSFVDRDGIYQTTGGEKVPITGDLYPLFPHDGQPGQAVNGYAPPDFTIPNNLRLSYCNNQLYFDYTDTNGQRASWMFDRQLKGWFFDSYTSPAMIHYAEEGKGVNSLLMGCSDGTIQQSGGTSDNGAAINMQVRTRAEDGGEQRADKLFGDIMVDIDPASAVGGVIVKPYIDNFDASLGPSVLGAGDVARNHYLVDILNGAGKLARNIAIDLTCAAKTSVILYEWEPSLIIKAEDTVARFTDWDDLGYSGAKFIQGLVLEADTENIARVVDIQYDGANVGATLAVKHNGQTQVPYSFPPFVGHLVRFAPKDTEFWKLYKWRFIYEPAPELAVNWTTQGTTHDAKGYMHVREALIALEAPADVVLTVNVDGTDYVYQIANTGGAYRKIYVPFQAVKGKLFTYKLTSAQGFRLYARDCEVRVRQWGAAGPYVPVNPFGDIHRIQGARI